MPDFNLRIAGPDGEFGAYLATPARTKTRAGAIVVCQEIFGVNADMRRTCDELAAEGFIALCPDLFWRQSPGVELSHRDDWEKALGFYQAFDLDAGVRDIGTALATARGLQGANGRAGVMGFCLGGLLTFLSAVRLRPDAAASFYGSRTEEFVGEAEGLKSPLMVHLAEEDEFMPRAAQQAITAALARVPAATVHSYAGCRHAFARHDGLHRDAIAARLATGRTDDFLHTHLTRG